ncbi:MAG TPA: hypothetical protein VGG89_08785 [Candidatus Baltobacteraceae bacterium]|jgi:hypothetical protein
MIRRFAFVLASLALISCGSKAVPAAPEQPFGASLLTPRGSATASLSFPIPSSDATNGFIPSETAAVEVSIHGVSAYQSGAVEGTTTFSATFPVPSGTDQFDIYLVDLVGHELAHAGTTQSMPAGKTTKLRAVFHGVVNQVQANLDLNPPVGTNKTVPFTITAKDAAGDTISGPVPYDKPLYVSQKTISAEVKLEGSRFVSPGDTLHVAYNGRLMTAPVDIAFSAPTSSGSYGTRPLSFLAQAYTTFSVKGYIQDIAVAPDHVLWFGACGGNSDGCEIGNVDTAGRVHKVARVHYVQNLIVGPDRNVWFTEGENIRGEKGPTVGRVTPSGQVTQYLIRPTGIHRAFGTYAITTGPDGNIWFTEFNAVDRITTKGKITSFPTTAELRTTSMVAGSDGKIYFDVWEWSVGSCDMKGHISFYGSEKQPLGAPLVWNDGELLVARGPWVLTEAGSIHHLRLQDASIMTSGPSGTVVGAGVAQGSGLYGIQVSKLARATLKGKTYPEISAYNANEALTNVVADTNGYFWAASRTVTENGAIVRFRYDP